MGFGNFGHRQRLTFKRFPCRLLMLFHRSPLLFRLFAYQWKNFCNGISMLHLKNFFPQNFLDAIRFKHGCHSWYINKLDFFFFKL